MLGKFFKISILLALMVSVSACSRGNSNRPILSLRGSPVAPDEFLVVPQNPLETPADLTNLPAPDPAAGNRADIDFEAELLTQLGGNSTNSRGIPMSEMPLVTASRTNGTTENIRSILANEAEAFRTTNARRIEKLFKKRTAVAIYDPFLLDPYAEMLRLRALGVKTPSAPPAS